MRRGSCLWGALAQETIMIDTTENAETKMIEFFISKDSFVDLTCNRHYIGYDGVPTYEIMFTG